MAIDSNIAALGKPVENAAWPRVPCPSCMDSRVQFNAPAEFPDPSVEKFRDHPAWEPDWIRGSFQVDGICESSDCRQVVLGIGTYFVDAAEDDYTEQYAT